MGAAGRTTLDTERLSRPAAEGVGRGRSASMRGGRRCTPGVRATQGVESALRGRRRMSPEDREAYAAPPAYRPMSAGAITALVLSIVLLLPALFGIWWVEIAPILIAALCWGGISGGRRRGAGLAIAASIVALLGGLAALAGHRMLADKVETALT